jgi:maltokinase
MTSERDGALTRLVETWLTNRGHHPRAAGSVAVRRAEVIHPGRPGLLDVVADVENRQVHIVVGLRSVGDEPHFLRPGEEEALGLLEDDNGLAVCTDALRDAQLAPLTLASVRGVDPRPGVLTVVTDDDDEVVLDCGDRGDLIVFPWLADRPRPDVDLMMALDEAGFNHVAAPLVRWVWEGRDLGVVQEPLIDRSSGWALALTSLRDLYASGGTPEEAGGDFGPEAHALGTMTARMHLALDRAYLRHHEPVADWAEEAEAELRQADPTLLNEPGVQDLFKGMLASETRLPVLRTHGDFHLGRTSRTDQGWVVSDCRPGGVLPAMFEPSRRSPLCDVADLLWSLHQASLAAASERDRAGRQGLAALGQSWEARNRRAVLSGYLSTPGMGGLSGADRELVINLVALFELARSVRSGP